MKPTFWLDTIPLWGAYAVFVVCVFIIIWIGTFLGLRISRRPDHETETPVGTIIGASLGLVAFMLAFTFGITTQNFQTKRQLFLNEVNAIGTTYLRAGLILEPHKGEVRRLLREYVDIRVNLAKESTYGKQEKILAAVSNADLLQDQIWSHAVAVSEADHYSPIDALFIDSLNKMIDLQTSRVTVGSYRIPEIIWYALYFITILSMLMVGYQTGLSGKRNLKMGIFLALTFSTVFILIVDLDRSTEGFFKLNQWPMFELQKKMQVSTQETEHEQILLDSRGVSDEKTNAE